MALILDFTITQPTDCNNITFTETTGEYSSPDNEGGYGTPNPIYNTVLYTLLEVTMPDGTVKIIDKGYKPTQNASPNGTFDISASDLGYTTMPNGIYNFNYKIYSNNIGTTSIVQDTEYIVRSGTISYDGTTYEQGDTFIGTATTTYTNVSGSATVSSLLAIKDCNFLIYCNLRECLRKLMLMRCDDCDCKDAIAEGVTELVIDFNAAVLAFNLGNYDCAKDTIERLEKSCSGICNDCNC